MYKFCLFYIVLFFIFSNIIVKAQIAENDDSLVVNSVVSDTIKEKSLSDLHLPPVSIFLESAYTHPSTKIYETYTEEETQKLKTEKKKWLNFFRVSGNYQYGQNNSIVEGGANNAGSYYSGDTRSTFNVGASVFIPIGDLLSQKSNIAAQKAKVSRVAYEYEIALEERKLKILSAYNGVVKLLSVLKAKADAAVLYNAQMKLSENDFVNGKLSAIVLSLERARRSTAVVSYEEARMELQSAIVLLETLTGISIIK